MSRIKKLNETLCKVLNRLQEDNDANFKNVMPGYQAVIETTVYLRTDGRYVSKYDSMDSLFASLFETCKEEYGIEYLQDLANSPECDPEFAQYIKAHI